MIIISRLRADLQCLAGLAERAIQRPAAALQPSRVLALRFKLRPHFLQLGLQLKSRVASEERETQAHHNLF